MAVVIVNEIAGGDQGLYDALKPQTTRDGRLPEGCSLRIAGPVDVGWRVISVWDSEAQFESFRDGTLIPAIQEAGYGDRVTPRTEARPVYEVISS
ncbi:MAG: hypothetical protein QOK25_740 [Thermoleophilaceae bacterium]|jgi:hypothetical protein|nr:hypothetical protein [Thermoleophilaceae bacterium]